MRPKFKIWDKKMELWYMPTYRAYAGTLHQLLLTPCGYLIKKTMEGTAHESTFPDRYKVVMCTGEKDKNGKDIYYGDVYIGIGGASEVEDFTVAYWIIDSHKMNNPMKEVEIIGNVWESPDLVRETNIKRRNEKHSD